METRPLRQGLLSVPSEPAGGIFRRGSGNVISGEPRRFFEGERIGLREGTL